MTQKRTEELNEISDKILSHTKQLANTETDLTQRGVNIRQPPYNAKGDGVTDDTIPIQSAITYAQDNSMSLYIPSGTYLTSQTLHIGKRLRFYGDGMRTTKIKYNGDSAALKIKPSSSQHSTFYNLHDFSIEPIIGGRGTHGLEIELIAGSYFSNWEIHRIYIGDFGSYGIFLNNNINNSNGFFTGTLRRSWITNGIKGTKVGDSIIISENTITGKNTGVSFTHQPGSGQVVIRENNITTTGGAISLIGGEKPIIVNNQMEHPRYLGNYTGSVRGFINLKDTVSAEIRGNTLSTSASAIIAADFAIYFDGTCALCVITNNTLVKGKVGHVGFGATAYSNIIKDDNSYDTSRANRVFMNTGVKNKGIDVLIKPQSGWVAYDIASDVYVKKLENGLIILRGAIKNGAITQTTTIITLPDGFRPNRVKRFQVTNFDGLEFSSATILIQTSGAIQIMAAKANNLLQLDGISFTED
ncbi:hypothetical protein JFV29_19970 [Peribacillus sp. TH16]|uniref:glycosyl hydrolase family 28-related protein n=1 Tax=Peribacillus sp. TH16 TaxID=2798482 RepID=UPI0019128757|nr:glycosyl hydrolase family 28-related protein [Peribacillus sp. TH16]MBK5484122.1 hypothetical protein [Peribacillus sp. TH16]